MTRNAVLLLSALLACPAFAQSPLHPNGAPGLHPNGPPPGKAGAEEGQKLIFDTKVLQVLPDGLLFSKGQATVILVGYPKKVADGEIVKCYALKTDQTIEYTDVTGAKRTARVYKYAADRIGK